MAGFDGKWPDFKCGVAGFGRRLRWIGIASVILLLAFGGYALASGLSFHVLTLNGIGAHDRAARQCDDAEHIGPFPGMGAICVLNFDKQPKCEISLPDGQNIILTEPSPRKSGQETGVIRRDIWNSAFATRGGLAQFKFPVSYFNVGHSSYGISRTLPLIRVGPVPLNTTSLFVECWGTQQVWLCPDSWPLLFPHCLKLAPQGNGALASLAPSENSEDSEDQREKRSQKMRKIVRTGQRSTNPLPFSLVLVPLLLAPVSLIFGCAFIATAHGSPSSRRLQNFVGIALVIAAPIAVIITFVLASIDRLPENVGVATVMVAEAEYSAAHKSRP